MRISTGIVFLLLASVFAFGQGGTDEALVVGTITDPTGAVVSGASVKLVHLATNSTTEVRSDERGEYRTPPLRIGEYTINVEFQGFKRFNQRGVVLNIGDVRKVDVTLQVGQASESVDVVGSGIPSRVPTSARYNAPSPH